MKVENSNNFSFEEYCRTIDLYSACMDDYPYIMDMQKDRYFISQKAVERFNVPRQLFSDVINTHGQFVYEEDLQNLKDDLASMIRGDKEEHNIQYRWLDREKKPVWINCRGRLLRDEEGNPTYMIGCVNEIGQIAKADNVSGLLQSTFLKNIIETKQINLKQGFFLRLGIDGFKDINERFGDEYGDFVIHGVAECITRRISKSQEVYHVTGDEYLIVDRYTNDEEVAHELYREIRREMDSFIEDNNYEAVYTISGGLLMLEELGKTDYQTLMKLSEFALNEAKNKGRNQLYIYKNKDYDNFIRRREILVDLKQAVANNFEGFELYYQPIMTSSASGEKLFAAESLLRFVTKEGERIAPVEFVPILESSGLIIPVGKWILNEACSMCKLCQETYPDFKISVNLSYVQIIKSALVNEIFNCIARHGLKPESMIMEMTESGFLEDSLAVKRVWGNLKKFGVNIAIDDFGTGYSNLSSISKLAPDIIKIDRGFTLKALTNTYENELMHHVVQLVHSINLKICVEGIENDTELTRINEMNPDFIQGYHYARPVSKKDFLEKFIYPMNMTA